MILSARAVRRLSKVAARNLDQIATVYRLKAIPDRPKGRERWPDDWETHLTGEPCLVSSTRVRPIEQIGGAQTRMTAEYTIAFKKGTDVNEQHIVVVTSLANRTFRLVGPMSAGYEFIRIMQANEIT